MLAPRWPARSPIGCAGNCRCNWKPAAEEHEQDRVRHCGRREAIQAPWSGAELVRRARHDERERTGRQRSRSRKVRSHRPVRDPRPRPSAVKSAACSGSCPERRDQGVPVEKRRCLGRRPRSSIAARAGLTFSASRVPGCSPMKIVDLLRRTTLPRPGRLAPCARHRERSDASHVVVPNAGCFATSAPTAPAGNRADRRSRPGAVSDHVAPSARREFRSAARREEGALLWHRNRGATPRRAGITPPRSGRPRAMTVVQRGRKPL